MLFQPLSPALLQPCAAPGRLTELFYATETHTPDHTPLQKRALVYLPHGYDDDPQRRYPVLYLMHGGGGDENEIFGGLEGKTGLRHVLDHAIAAGYAQPMIVVTPTYLVEGVEAARQSLDVAVQLTHRFPTELHHDVISAVDAALRTLPDRKHRAFGGFSMGGETTWSVMIGALQDVWCFMPLSGDYWAMGLKAGKDFPEETADALVSPLRQSGLSPSEWRVMAFTGDKDIAYPAMKPMVEALARRTDCFTLGDMPGDGNLTWCVKENGWHTYDDCWEYIYLALPHLFA